MTSIRLSFRAKTAITLTSVGALIIFAVSWLTIQQIYSDQESALLVRSQSVSELFAATARDAVNASDLATLDSLTQEILALPGLVIAVFALKESRIEVILGARVPVSLC